MFAIITGVLALPLAVLYVFIYFLSHTPRKEIKEANEHMYVTTTSSGSKSQFYPLPELSDEPTIDLSIVVPCYNETKRLKGMLVDCLDGLQLFKGSWELLLVDDGSKDGTSEYALKLAHELKIKPDQLRVSVLVENRGKGGAVAHGMKHARGSRILFADADGASSFKDAFKLYDAIGESGCAVAIGSRAHLVNTDAVVKRTFIRNFLMYGLHTLLYLFGIRCIRDTQCGFKMFTREAAAKVFPYMHTERWIFDVEVLILAMRKNIPVHEIPISWHEVDGSKIDLARDTVLMAVDLVVIRFAYLFGIYKDH